MSVQSEKFIAGLRLIESDGKATPYFREFLGRVDSFIQQASEAPPEIVSVSDNPYEAALSDANKLLRFTEASVAVTIPVEADTDFATGTVLRFRFAGTGTHTITTTGLTINGTIPTLSQNSEIALRKVGADEWDVI